MAGRSRMLLNSLAQMATRKCGKLPYGHLIGSFRGWVWYNRRWIGELDAREEEFGSIFLQPILNRIERRRNLLS